MPRAGSAGLASPRAGDTGRRRVPRQDREPSALPEPLRGCGALVQANRRASSTLEVKFSVSQVTWRDICGLVGPKLGHDLACASLHFPFSFLLITLIASILNIHTGKERGML